MLPMISETLSAKYPLRQDAGHRRNNNPLITPPNRFNMPNRAYRPLRRITMNPPESFIQYAALTNSQAEPVKNSPIVFGQGGQAVMVSPAQNQNQGNSNGNGGAGAGATQQPNQVNQGTQAGGGGGDIQLAPNSDANAGPISVTSITAESAVVSTQTTPTSNTIPPTTDAPSTQTPGSTSMPTALLATTQAATSVPAMDTPGAASFVSSSEDSQASISSSYTSASISTITSASGLPSSSSSSPSTSASASVSASATPAQHLAFSHTAPFIFLCVLGTLVIVAIFATSLSWIFRRPWFPCCSRLDDDDDPDGLSEIVQSFHSHSPSRSSTLRRSNYTEKDNYDGDNMDDPELALNLHRRSSLFANDPSQSPFLHSGQGLGQGQSATMWDLPGGGGGNGAPSIAVPMPAHLFGVTGPLEVRNAAPGDEDLESGMETEGSRGYDDSQVGRPRTPREGMAGFTPRFLGVDGDGLDVPWGRQAQATSQPGIIGLGIDTHPDSALTSPYVSAPDARDYLGQPFPSPLSTVDEQHRMMTAASSPEHGDHSSPSPQRAGTWASNLRSTLFAAIAGARAGTSGADNDHNSEIGRDGDRFTRTILPLHRNSTRRTAKGNNNSSPNGVRAFPVVMEEDDHYAMSRSDVEAIGSVFLAPTFSASSASTLGVTIPRRAKMPLRGGAGERYKRYYTRSSGASASSAEESGTESVSGWTVDDRIPSRLAGGERAKGLKSQ